MTRTYSDNITYNAASLMTQERLGVNALSANLVGLFLNKHYNKRLQNYDIRLGTNGGDEWSWNRGALRLFYHSDGGLGAQASCLPFASGARQTTVARGYPEDQVIRSPRLRERRFHALAVQAGGLRSQS